jgi:lipoprotein-anchoring transpeptidase ErfK/SrfK
MTRRRATSAATRLRRATSGLAVTLVTAGIGGPLVAPAGAAPMRVPASQPIVILLNDHAARSGPGATMRLVETVRARRPLTGVATVLPVIARRRGDDGSSWVRVRLPGRPLGHTGWIAAANTRRDTTEWHIVVRLAARQVVVYRDGLVQRRFAAVVGKTATPTPRGRFFVEEAVALAAADAGSPFALATSARSQVLQQFEGGPGQIALHGTGNLSSPLGSAASHGCVRISPRAISWLASRIGGGVPMTIVS